VQAGVSIAITRKARFRQDVLAEASPQEEAVRAQVSISLRLASQISQDDVIIADILVDTREGIR
jgi:hypothetical protein